MKLICPKCKKKEKEKNTGISRFSHSETKIKMASCKYCNHSWSLEPTTKSVPIKSLKQWLVSRSIPSVGLENIPAKIACWQKKDGSISKMQAIHFLYPEKINHIISLQKIKSKPIQLWQPEGERKKHISLFNYINPKIKQIEPETLYLCEGEKDGLALGQHGFTFAAVAGASNFKSKNANWIKDKFPNVTKIRVCFDSDEAGQKGAADAIKKITGYDIEILQYSNLNQSSLPSDLCDILKANPKNFSKTLREMKWITSTKKKLTTSTKIKSTPIQELIQKIRYDSILQQFYSLTKKLYISDQEAKKIIKSMFEKEEIDSTYLALYTQFDFYGLYSASYGISKIKDKTIIEHQKKES
jgi:hypothetical protein